MNRGFAWLIASLLFFMLMSASYFLRVSFRPIKFVHNEIIAISAVIPILGFILYYLLKMREDRASMHTRDTESNAGKVPLE